MARDQIVVITGASAGVGRATAREFARRGAKLGLLARNISALRAAREEVENLGGEALILPTDVSDPQQVEAAARQVEKRFGPIDVWVNNAMVTVFSPVKEMTPQEYRRVTEVTYLGYVYGTLAALKHMGPRNRGTIIQVGSALAWRSLPLQSAYCAAKHAIRGFTESLRCELIHDRSRIEVCMVQMPALNTPLFSWSKSRLPRKPRPVPPIFQPEVAARAVIWAVDHPKKEIWVGASTAKAILAEKFASGMSDRYLARRGYDAQQFDGPASSNRPHNLWDPMDEDRGAHGIFDSHALVSSRQFWLSTNRSWLLPAGLLSIAALWQGARWFGDYWGVARVGQEPGPRFLRTLSDREADASAPGASEEIPGPLQNHHSPR